MAATPINAPEFLASKLKEFEQRGITVTTFEVPDSATKQARIETQFSELADGTLVELVEDPAADADRTLLAVWKGGAGEYLAEFKDGDRVLVPFPRTNEILRSIRLPKGVGPYRSAEALLEALEELILRCVAIQPKYIQVLADFVLSTWFIECSLSGRRGSPAIGKDCAIKTSEFGMSSLFASCGCEPGFSL